MNTNTFAQLGIHGSIKEGFWLDIKSLLTIRQNAKAMLGESTNVAGSRTEYAFFRQDI